MRQQPPPCRSGNLFLFVSFAADCQIFGRSFCDQHIAASQTFNISADISTILSCRKRADSTRIFLLLFFDIYISLYPSNNRLVVAKVTILLTTQRNGEGTGTRRRGKWHGGRVDRNYYAHLDARWNGAEIL